MPEQGLNLYDEEKKAADVGFIRLIQEITAKHGAESEIGKALMAALQLAIEEQSNRKAAQPPLPHKALREILAESIFGGPYQGAYALESVAMLAMIRSYAESAMQSDLLQVSVVTERAAMEQAGIDPLTQAFNRRKMNEVLEQWLPDPPEKGRREHLEKKQVVPFAVVLFDLDHFKDINDTYGHLIGDEVLVAFAQFLKANLRTESSDDVVARWGGEEFLVLMRADEQQVAAKLQSLLEKLRAANLVASRDYLQVRASIGWTMFDPDSISSDALPKRDLTASGLTHEADLALYSAKHNGRDGVQKY
jgi:diguanylate cyclase (GGDEF)-like protein